LSNTSAMKDGVWMQTDDPHFLLRLATDELDLRAAQRLRYRVFVEELGGNGTLVDHDNRLECDEFDPLFDHMILIDDRRDAAALDHVVGVYRLLRGDRAAKIGRFYTDSEYDLSALIASGKNLLELGRSCLHEDYRGGTAMLRLWSAVSQYVEDHDIDVLFGVASFHGTDIDALSGPLSLLHHKHLVPPELYVRSKKYQPMNLMPDDRIDRVAAMRATPALIKGYLRMGARIGDGAFVDEAFNTTDVCLVMDMKAQSARHRAIYHERANV